MAPEAMRVQLNTNPHSPGEVPFRPSDRMTLRFRINA